MLEATFILIVAMTLFGVSSALQCYTGSSSFKHTTECDSDFESCLTIIPLSDTELDQAKFECGDESNSQDCKEEDGKYECFCTGDLCNHSNDLMMCNSGTKDDHQLALCRPGVKSCYTKIMGSDELELSCGPVMADDEDIVEGCAPGSQYDECYCKGKECNTGDVPLKCYTATSKDGKVEKFCSQTTKTCLTSRNTETGENEFSCGVQDSVGCNDMGDLGMDNVEECHCIGNLCNNDPLQKTKGASVDAGTLDENFNSASKMNLGGSHLMIGILILALAA